jgi:hypothetical protein
VPFRPTSSSSGEFIRHRLAAAVLPVSAATDFPDLRIVMMDLPMTWTLSIASVVPQYLSRAGSVLADTLIGHIGRQQYWPVLLFVATSIPVREGT